MYRITSLIVLFALVVGCSSWMTQQRGKHRPELAPDGSAYFPAYDLLGRQIDALHPDTCPLPAEELERLVANGYTVVNGFARETDPPYGPTYPTWICIGFAGPGLMDSSLLAATMHNNSIVAAEVSFRPPSQSDLESVVSDLQRYFTAQCQSCEPQGEESLTCLDCTSSARVELAIDRGGPISRVKVGYFLEREGLVNQQRVVTGGGSDYFGF
ncbi:MAG: hypothetical protein JW797_08075 [Bradymonadales bacterium]|nr:hypothetical protein [Bradymonadales bacterium]